MSGIASIVTFFGFVIKFTQRPAVQSDDGKTKCLEVFWKIKDNSEKVKQKSNTSFLALCPAHDDKNPSLSVSLNKEKTKVLLHCFAGCRTEDIAEKYGLSLSDLMGAASVIEPAKEKSVTVDDLAEAKGIPADFLRSIGLTDFSGGVVIPYCDASGSSIIHNGVPLNRYRVGPPSESVTRSKRGDPVHLYGLDRIKKDKPLWIVEGESDCWALWYIGESAVGVPGAGATKTLRALKHRLSSISEIIISEEDDQAGRIFSDKVLREIHALGFVGAIYFCRWSDSGVKDACDLLTMEGSKDAFSSRIAGIKQDLRNRLLTFSVSAVARLTKTKPPKTAHVEHARNLAKVLRGDVHYDPSSHSWLVWASTSKEWRKTSHGIFNLIADYFGALGHSCSENTVRATENALRHILDSDIDTYDLDLNSLLVKNGLVDLRTGEMREVRRADLMVSKCTARYIPGIRSDVWEEHLMKVFAGNLDLVDCFQRAIGYSLFGHTRERVIFIVYGPGRNGKTKTLEIIKRILGSYACTFSISFLTSESSRPDPTYEEIRVARFACCSEVREKAHFNEAMVKSLTGGDTIVGRNLFSTKNIKFQPRAKFWLIVNSLPSVSDTSPAFWDRIRVIPFLYRIRENEMIRDLDSVLWAERDAILTWAIEGAVKYHESGLTEPDACREMRLDYQVEEDDLGQFVAQHIGAPDGKGTSIARWVKFSEIYSEYTKFCERERITYRKSRKSVSSYLRNRGFARSRRADGIEYYVALIPVEW